jgi:hypothetical protein
VHQCLIFNKVARNPQKLRDLLVKNHGLPPLAINNLKIVEGSCTELGPVKATLAPDGKSAGLIVVGVGALAKMQMSISEPFVMDQPTICEDTSNTILMALRELRREGVIEEAQKPIFLAISTTGATKERDVTFDLAMFYHAALSVPHKDKAVMEELIAKASIETGPDAPISSFIFIRPSLLMDGVSKGMPAVRVGWLEHPAAPGAATGKAPGPAIGRTIRRSDVGQWMFENAIQNSNEWKGRCVTLTY